MKRTRRSNNSPVAVSGFTLIELLIVVAIIAVLAAIAVPNFLEAQTRSKVARTLYECRVIGMAFKAYNIDYNTLPRWWNGGYNYTGWLMLEKPPTQFAQKFVGSLLTTPIAYISSVPWDIWNTAMLGRNEYGKRPDWFAQGYKRQCSYVTVLLYPVYQGMYVGDGRTYKRWWEESFIKPYNFPNGDHTIELQSCGPDLLWWSDTNPSEKYYDPTNGSRSPGNIWWFDNYGSVPKR